MKKDADSKLIQKSKCGEKELVHVFSNNDIYLLAHNKEFIHLCTHVARPGTIDTRSPTTSMISAIVKWQGARGSEKREELVLGSTFTGFPSSPLDPLP